MSNHHSSIGLDVGGTQIKAAAFAAAGAVLDEKSAPTGDDGSREWMERARAVARSVTANCTAPACVGVAAPGLPSADRRSIAFMPGRLHGLERLDWQQWLALDRPVTVVNDAPAALPREGWVGAAKNGENAG